MLSPAPKSLKKKTRNPQGTQHTIFAMTTPSLHMPEVPQRMRKKSAARRVHTTMFDSAGNHHPMSPVDDDIILSS